MRLTIQKYARKKWEIIVKPSIMKNSYYEEPAGRDEKVTRKRDDLRILLQFIRMSKENNLRN